MNNLVLSNAYSNEVGSMFSSMPMETEAEKKALFNAINNPEDRVAEHINETITIKHVVAEMIELTNEETGEIGVFPRIIIVDDKGKSYQAVSVGVFSALKKIFGIFGEPASWEKPIKVKVKQITKKDRKMLTLELV